MRTGVVLMTYGSPHDLDDVAVYLSRVRGGRPASAELVEEFRRRYARIGGSPLVPITRRQAAALERALAPQTADHGIHVAAGMRFSEPTVARAVEALVADGAEQLLGLILSPQYSPILMGGYGRELEAAATALGVPARMVESWHAEPAFVAALATRIRAALAEFPPDLRDRVVVLQSAHSLPKRVLEQEPGYVEQLHETARAVAMVAGLTDERWRFVYQSAGHSPEPWLTPDLLDVLPELAAAGHRHALLTPVQFLADHLETLYDIDVAAHEQAEAAGVELRRVPAPNDAPDFIDALARVVRRALGTPPGAAPRPSPRDDAAARSNGPPPQPAPGRSTRVRVATRGSALARAQTELVVRRLRDAFPDLQVEVHTVVTAGDRTQDSAAVMPDWGQGVFVKEIEAALLSGAVDLGVHSLKDVPAHVPQGLALAAILERGDPRDALVTRDGCSLEELPPGARVGTSSARRAAFLRAVRPDLVCLPIRGNVDTRYRKLLAGDYEAILLARAGLSRLRLNASSAPLDPSILPPAPGQGALAVETRADDEATIDLVRVLHHPPTAAAVRAERAVMAELDSGCRLPLAALASPLEDGTLDLVTAVAAPDGSRVLWARERGHLDKPEALGRRVAAQLKEAGAEALLTTETRV